MMQSAVLHHSLVSDLFVLSCQLLWSLSQEVGKTAQTEWDRAIQIWDIQLPSSWSLLSLKTSCTQLQHLTDGLGERSIR